MFQSFNTGKYFLANIFSVEWNILRFAYDGEWKFADLLTMSAGKLAVKFVMDSVTGEEILKNLLLQWLM